MPRKCPPGVICLENMTLFILILIVIFLSYLFFNNQKNLQSISSNPSNPIIIQEKISLPFNRLNPLPSYSYTNDNSTLLNPYVPPLKNDNIYPNLPWNMPPIPPIPINIPTQSVDSTYRQVGILNNLNGSNEILPLMGKPLITNRDKWNFYTMTDKNNMIKLPLSHKGKSCTSEYGCDNIYNGDTVYVEGYKNTYKATIYDNDTMRYIPFL